MKRIIALCLAIACVCSFTACQEPAGGSEGTAQEGPSSTNGDPDASVSTSVGDLSGATMETPDASGVTTQSLVPHESDVTSSSVTTTLSGNGLTNVIIENTGNGTTAMTTSGKSTKPTNAAGSTAASSAQTSKPTTKPTAKPTTAAGHKHQWKSKTIVPATCTMKGYTQYNCACGYSEKSEYTEVLGHVFGDWKTVKNPTDTADGLAEQSCRRAGCTEKKTRSIPKLKVDADAVQLRVLELVNEQRAKEGLPKLFYYSAEQAAADLRIKEIKSSEKNFSHTRPNGEKFQTAMKGLGEEYFRCGENLAMGFDGDKAAEEVMSAWMNSPGHRKNIMSADFDALVVGYSKDGYWVQLFIGYE